MVIRRRMIMYRRQRDQRGKKKIRKYWVLESNEDSIWFVERLSKEIEKGVLD